MADTDPESMESGWCSNPRHSRFDHWLSATCITPVRDAENTRQLEAREVVARPAYDAAAAYVAEHRPY